MLMVPDWGAKSHHLTDIYRLVEPSFHWEFIFAWLDSRAACMGARAKIMKDAASELTKLYLPTTEGIEEHTTAVVEGLTASSPKRTLMKSKHWILRHSCPIPQ